MAKSVSSRLNNPLLIKLDGDPQTAGIVGVNSFPYDNSEYLMVNITPEAINASRNTHTHNYAGSDTPGGKANMTKGSLNIFLNGQPLDVYRGDIDLTVSIRPETVGAAPASHTHNYAGSNSAGGPADSTKGSLNIFLNGQPLDVYRGDIDLTVDIRPETVGASPASHTHNYAGSNSAGGPANSTKGSLNIQINGTTQCSFDGSSDKTINISASGLGADITAITNSEIDNMFNNL